MSTNQESGSVPIKRVMSDVARPGTKSVPAVQKARRLKFPKKKAVFLLVGVIFLLAIAGGAYYFVTKYQKAQDEITRLSNPQEVAQAEQEKLISAVGSLTDLPSGESPTIATVSDASKLKSQVFFANAQNGDKVLIYTRAKRAILYRPSVNKIIEIGPVNIGTDTPTQP